MKFFEQNKNVSLIIYVCVCVYVKDIFAVVMKKGNSYCLAIFCDDTVPPFGPTLPNPPEFLVSFLFFLNLFT